MTPAKRGEIVQGATPKLKLTAIKSIHKGDPMKVLILLLSLTASSLAFAKDKSAVPAGCDFFFKKEKICASLTWTKKAVVVAAPTAKDAAAFDLKIWDAQKSSAAGPFINLAQDKTLLVSLHMPAMGHGSEPVVLKKDEKAPGIYHVTQVLFSMEGDWEIRARIQHQGKIVDSASLPFVFK